MLGSVGTVEQARTMPTVVVARSPAPGREVEFEAWLRRLVAAARSQRGLVHADIQPPNSAHPDEWVVLYQFSDLATRDAWVDSEHRRALLAEGAPFVAGPGREQVIALASQPEPVTAVASFTVRPGNQHRYREFHDRLVARLSTFPGFLRSEVFEPVEGVQPETVVVLAFDSREHLDAWLCSDERQRMLAEIEPFILGDRTINVVGGFAGWFGGEMAGVRKWKQATVVLAAMAPTTLALTALRREVLPDLHWVPGVLFGTVLGTIALTWLLMPWLTRLLAGWLRR